MGRARDNRQLQVDQYRRKIGQHETQRAMKSKKKEEVPSEKSPAEKLREMLAALFIVLVGTATLYAAFYLVMRSA
ncbi:hypothetical protein QOT17_013867 [Balamuthia mandrillaris]